MLTGLPRQGPARFWRTRHFVFSAARDDGFVITNCPVALVCEVVPTIVGRMRIVVTGAAGKIGRPTAEALLARGHDVLGVDRRELDGAEFSFLLIDLQDTAAVVEACVGASVVVHLGEIPNMLKHLTAGEVFSGNTRTGANVMQACVQNSVARLVYVSTCQVYGIWGSPQQIEVQAVALPMDESQPLAPLNAYAASKVANEALFSSMACTTPVTVAAVRFPWIVTGPMKTEWSAKWWRQADSQMHEGYWSYLAIEDAVDLLVRAAESNRPGFEAYHAVAPRATGDRPIAERLHELRPHGPQLPADWRGTASPVCCAKARSHFGWESKIDMRALIFE